MAKLEIYLGIWCTHCGTDVDWDAGRIASDGEAKLTLTSGREDKTLDVIVDGFMCSTCQEVECDSCGKRSKDYETVDAGDGTGMFACATCMGREEDARIESIFIDRGNWVQVNIGREEED